MSKHKTNCPQYGNFQPPYADCNCGAAMTNLHDINFGLNQYCGPAVMSALTGRNTDECAAAIARVTGRTTIRGIQTAELIRAFGVLRYKAEKVPVVATTIYGNISVNLINKSGLYIIAIPGHFVALEVTEDKQVYIVDNHSKEPLNAGASARLSQKVESIYKFTPKEPLELMSADIKVRFANKVYFITREYKYNDASANSTQAIGHIEAANEGQFLNILEEIQQYMYTHKSGDNR